MAESSDRNLLLGIVALQMSFITRDQLVAGMHAWVLRREIPLEQVLFEQRALSAEIMALLQGLVAKHQELHDNDPRASLRAIGSASSIDRVRNALESVAAADVQATLSDWQAGSRAEESARNVGSGPNTGRGGGEEFFSRIEGVCDQFAQAWLSGQRPRIEDYLPQLPERAQRELLEELLRTEILLRRSDDEAVSAGDYAVRFPTHRSAIDRALKWSEPSLGSSQKSGRETGSRPGKNRFRILRAHARGGLGEVFLAKDTELNRDVALKEIQDRHARNPESRSRFLLEAEVTGALEHPGIVPVYGLGQYADGRPFYAMRFVKGDSLREAIRKFHEQNVGARDITFGEVGVEFRKLLGRFIDVCQAIEYAHSRGVLHRDLKPGNIMLGKYGETLVVDWGLAKVVGRAERHKNSGDGTICPEGGSGSAPTQLGAAIGTPAYMSPEQAAGRIEELGPGTDVYSLGATLYHLLTGRPPFQGGTAQEILQRVQSGSFPRPSEAWPEVAKIPGKDRAGPCRRGARFSPALEAICLKAMALNPQTRYASAGDLAQDMERFLADEPVSARQEPWNDQLRRWGRKHQTAVVALSVGGLVATAAAIGRGLGGDLALATGVLVALAGLTALASITARKNLLLSRAITGLTQAKLEADAARRRAERSADESRRNLYVSRMNLMQKNWEADQVAIALDLLRNYGPESPQADLRGFEWHYFARQVDLALTTLAGHSVVGSVTFSADGTRLASASEDNTIRVWDVATGEETATLTGHSQGIQSVVFSPDGTRLASAGWDETIKLWELATGKEIATLTGHSQGILSVAFSPDGRRIASGSWDKTVKLWDLSTGQETAHLQGHSGWVLSVAFSPDGTRLASASVDNTIKLWEVATGRESATLEGHSHLITRVTFSPDGTRLVSTSYDQTIRLWDVFRGQETAILTGHSGEILSVAFRPDGRQLASGGVDRTLRLWDVITGQNTATLTGHSQEILCVAFSRDGMQLATGSGDKTVRLWDVATGDNTAHLKGHSEAVYSVAFSPDGTRLASASHNLIKLWDVFTPHDTATLHGHLRSIHSVAFSPDGQRLATGSEDHTIKLWDVATGQQTATLAGHFQTVKSVVFSPDGTRLASGSIDSTIKLWDVASGQETATLTGHSGGVRGLAFSPDGTRLASGSDDTTIKLWEVTSGQETATLQGHSQGVFSVAYSADGTQLASGSADNTIKLWNASTRQETAALTGHSQGILSVAFSPDGTHLASGSSDRTIKLWNVSTGQETATLTGHLKGILGVVFSPDGKRLVSGSHDHSLKLWDISTGQETATLLRHLGWVESVAFSPDGMRLASASADQTVKLWDARPWTAATRREQQALCLVRGTLPKADSVEALIRAIRANRTFTPETREQAVKFAPVFWQNRSRRTAVQ